MSSPSYYSVVQIPYIENPVIVNDNQAVGYKWYQSSLSSDRVNLDVVPASPCSCGCQQLFLRNPVDNPNMYYPVEYRPPPAPPHLFHSIVPPSPVSKLLPEMPTHQVFDKNSERNPEIAGDNYTTGIASYAPPFTLTCHTTLSTSQPYYPLESPTSVTSTTVMADALSLIDNLPTDNKMMITGATTAKGNQWEDKLTQMIALIEKMQDNVADMSNVVDKKVQGKTMKVEECTLPHQSEYISTKLLSPISQTDSAVKPKLGVVSTLNLVGVDAETVVGYVDKSLSVQGLDNVSDGASSAVVIGFDNMCNKLAKKYEYSLMMDNLLINQTSNSITEYVQDFMDLNSRASFIFNCDFDDDLLAYCFVNGLKEAIRDALELWAPLTLQEAVYWAAIQESLLEEKLSFEAPKDGTAVGECQAITVEESFMIQANNKEMFEVVEKQSGGLNEESELQVERRVVVTTYVNALFAENFGVRKQAVVDQIPSVTLSTMEESFATFVDVAEESVPDYVHDSQRQTKDVCGMGSHFVRPNLKVSAANTYGLNKHHGNIFGGETILIFDPGGLELQGQPCVIKMPKQMIRKFFQDEEEKYIAELHESESLLELRSATSQEGNAGNQPRAFTIANYLDKRYGNVGQKNLCHFDQGGGKFAASNFTTEVGIVELFIDVYGYVVGMWSVMSTCWNVAALMGLLCGETCLVSIDLDEITRLNLFTGVAGSETNNQIKGLQMKVEVNREIQKLKTQMRVSLLQQLYNKLKNWSRVLKMLGHIDDDGVVQLTGRAAGLIDVGDEIIVTALIFNGTSYCELHKSQLISLLKHLDTFCHSVDIPETVTSLRPLELESQDLSQGNAWFCPILKQCIVSSCLNFSIESIFDMMGLPTKKSEAHEREGNIYLSRTTEGLTYTSWLLPPSFCNYPLDMAESFKELEKILCGKLNEVAVKLPRMLWRPGISYTDRSEARQLQGRTTFVAVTTSPLVYSCWETEYEEVGLVCYKKATFLNVSWLTSTLHLHTQLRRLLIQKFQRHDPRGAAIQSSPLRQIWNASTLAIVEIRFLAWYWSALCLVFNPGECDYLEFSQILSFLRTRIF